MGDRERSFVNSFLEVLCQVDLTDLRGGVISSYFLHIVRYHEFNELLKGRGLRIPTEFAFGFGRISEEVYHVCRAIEVRTDSHYGISDFESFSLRKCRIDACDDSFFVYSFAFPLQINTCVVERECCELADAMLYAGSDDEVLRRIVLKD